MELDEVGRSQQDYYLLLGGEKIWEKTASEQKKKSRTFCVDPGEHD